MATTPIVRTQALDDEEFKRLYRGKFPIVHISDLIDRTDPQGRTFQEINAEKVHKYPVGALVELMHGPRLFVVHHARDCDQTPLYCLAVNPTDTEIERDGFYNDSWIKGIPEEALTFIRMVNAPEDGRVQ